MKSLDTFRYKKVHNVNYHHLISLQLNDITPCREVRYEYDFEPTNSITITGSLVYQKNKFSKWPQLMIVKYTTVKWGHWLIDYDGTLIRLINDQHYWMESIVLLIKVQLYIDHLGPYNMWPDLQKGMNKIWPIFWTLKFDNFLIIACNSLKFFMIKATLSGLILLQKAV